MRSYSNPSTRTKALHPSASTRQLPYLPTHSSSPTSKRLAALAPNTPRTQLEALQQELALISSHALLALPDAAEVVAQHVKADAVGWVAHTPSSTCYRGPREPV
jgi:hypothetical protein